MAEALGYAIARMEAVGHLGPMDFARAGKAHHAPNSDWASFLVKHLAYLGWGVLLKGESLQNPLFEEE